MHNILIKVLIVVGIVIVLGIVYGLIMTFKTQHSSYQSMFLKGALPSPAPDGFFPGKSLIGDGMPGNWQGKIFDAKTNSGWNKFHDGNRYMFATRIDHGLWDTQLAVFKLDYNNSTNPWYLRFLEDELVQTSPGHYLGKLNLKIIPGLPFAIGYFSLEAPQTSGGCKISGCSHEVCGDQELYTICSFKAEYACYTEARCERQSNGRCGWTQTPELTACLKLKKTL